MDHALGPWKVNFAQHRGDYSIDNERGDIEIARTGSRKAAYLIAAAPELLAALEFSASVHRAQGLYDMSERMAVEMAEAAITRAEKGR